MTATAIGWMDALTADQPTARQTDEQVALIDKIIEAMERRHIISYIDGGTNFDLTANLSDGQVTVTLSGSPDEPLPIEHLGICPLRRLAIQLGITITPTPA